MKSRMYMMTPRLTLSHTNNILTYSHPDQRLVFLSLLLIQTKTNIMQTNTAQAHKYPENR